jgi:hypothetical protein
VKRGKPQNQANVQGEPEDETESWVHFANGELMDDDADG